MTESNLFEKTELRIENISLCGVNLNDVAAAAAEVLGLDRDEVLVTDALNDTLTIDIMRKTIDAHQLVGKQEQLFQQLSQIPGVEITDRTTICSEGMLGWIALEEPGAKEALERSEKMAAEIRKAIAKRVIVFSTGFEVSSGQIEDTNKPTIAKRLEAEGYTVNEGATLQDDKHLIAAALREAIESGGYGLIVTTGGVGAEKKDQTVEAVLSLDPEASTPYISKYEQGTGRHHKDGVRIAVGAVSDSVIVALPGPNDEVRSSLEILIDGLQNSHNKELLAELLAENLRTILREKMMHH
jgi:molybdenum cofactor synthesis domain-containing protein